MFVINIPSHYICPLTKEIMKSPVLASDKNIYEKESFN